MRFSLIIFSLIFANHFYSAKSELPKISSSRSHDYLIKFQTVQVEYQPLSNNLNNRF
jgi:hypothetical protein